MKSFCPSDAYITWSMSIDALRERIRESEARLAAHEKYGSASDVRDARAQLGILRTREKRLSKMEPKE